ncbi:MAG: xylulokinase [Beutenbergiaceae bacterium]
MSSARLDSTEANQPVGESVLAFDCGTGSLKAAVIAPGGSIRAEASAGYRLYQGSGGLAEQDGDEIWTAAVTAGREVLARAAIAPARIGALVFAATWKAILPLAPDGRPLSRAAIWMDSRGREQARTLNQRLGRHIGTGQEFWPRVMRLRQEEPALWHAASSVVGLNTYLKFRATGVLANEPSDDFAFGSDPLTHARYDEVMDAAGLAQDRHKFVPPQPAESIVGQLQPTAAAELGLLPGTPVFNGFSDLSAIMVGTGSGAPGRAHIYLGSSSWFVVSSSSPAPMAPLSFTVSEHLHGAAYVIQSACLAYDWAVAQFYHHEVERLGKAVNLLVNEEVAQVPAGSADLLATHWLNGELPPLSKNSRGLFLNVTPLHDRRHMVRAVMESICYAHRSSYDAYVAQGGDRLDRIRVVGGGARSDVWMQMLADVLEIPVEVPSNPQSTGTVGAYFATEVGRGSLASFADVDQSQTAERSFQPHPAASRTYRRLFAIHDRLHDLLQDTFSALNGLY